MQFSHFYNFYISASSHILVLKLGQWHFFLLLWTNIYFTQCLNFSCTLFLRETCNFQSIASFNWQDRNFTWNLCFKHSEMSWNQVCPYWSWNVTSMPLFVLEWHKYIMPLFVLQWHNSSHNVPIYLGMTQV